ncbi:MocR-like pyridoxine biosynthesis transcription factor PdxR [Paracoccus aminophilus]|uniref:GntR family transcriptional regulator/MocR family aminotransferase n=1 Tax=Paracoccus aminophilus JCM 7686 TaxID=1367847 RepID=S5XR37_PARAH|nr:PLP-dependent aminotransferase family protein [Paracoccus aminophilus]AGT09869.1 GntR family transcriptional regulator/MocR family aminotransferase [Paracoccus aminophilus JCM 7686]
MSDPLQSGGLLLSIRPDDGSGEPVYRQLAQQIRAAIRETRLARGTRLPASRILARELGLSRNTIVAAYELLESEGWIHSRIGAGAFVSNQPEDLAPPPPAALAEPLPRPEFSDRGRMLTSLSHATGSGRPVPFVADVPAFDVFPLATWSRLMAQSWREVDPSMLGYADPAGYMPLRDELARHLRAHRFLRCEGRDVIMTSGTQQSLDLLARILLDPGDAVWIEDPGYVGARSALIAAGARLVPVPVDTEGLMVDEGARREPRPKLIFITPSRQYPLGITMSMARRAELLAFAESCGAWVIEDDYDCEFRYSGAALPAVQSMDRSGRVIYLGTFSKSLLPSFRLGFFTGPADLATAFANAKAVVDKHPPLLEQVTLNAFMRSGRFAAHIRRMRQVYAGRQSCLLESLRRDLGDVLTVEPAETGVHLLAMLRPGLDDVAFCERARASGIALRPLSLYYLSGAARQGVIFGFAALSPKVIEAGVRKLARIFGDGPPRPS